MVASFLSDHSEVFYMQVARQLQRVENTMLALGITL